MSRTDAEKIELTAELIEEARRTFQALDKIAGIAARAFIEMAEIWKGLDKASE